MDDLRPHRPTPELWGRFALGERGRQISGLGGVRDRSSLALTAGRMRQDTIFRDTAHHFLRQFDKALQEFERNASDQDIAALAETRSARAFMLLGRVTGMFD
jgi:Ribonuclease G/E